MQNFNLGSLTSWKPIAAGEILDLETPTAGFRSVAFDILSSGRVAVNAVAGDDYWLVGYTEGGECNIKFVIDQPVGVVCIAEPGVDIFLRTLTDAPVIPESLEASYTTIEPRPAGPSEDLRRMMHMVRINQERREAHYQQQLAALAAKVDQAATEAPGAPPAHSPEEPYTDGAE